MLQNIGWLGIVRRRMEHIYEARTLILSFCGPLHDGEQA
tara:strand:- start:1888 stop:2004 length:117 start_codon:yes stop_codon:yes gene_type:complete